MLITGLLLPENVTIEVDAEFAVVSWQQPSGSVEGLFLFITKTMENTNHLNTTSKMFTVNSDPSPFSINNLSVYFCSINVYNEVYFYRHQNLIVNIIFCAEPLTTYMLIIQIYPGTLAEKSLSINFTTHEKLAGMYNVIMLNTVLKQIY